MTIESEITLEAHEESEMRENDQNKANCPFSLEWIFGFNSKIPLINLTTDSSSKLFASASAHIFQIFRSDGNKMQSFVGHENDIIALETNSTGRFLVSADNSGIINVWDISIASEFPHPIRTIYEACSHQRKLSKVALSDDGKSIITATDGKGSSIKLWQWSYGIAVDGGDKSNDSFDLPEKYEQVESVRFSRNENDLTMFVVTTTNGIIFGQWDRKYQKLHKHFPARSISISFQYIDTIFVENSHKAMSISSCGSVVIWSDVLVSIEELDEAESCCISMSTSFRKEFVKNVKLGETSLRVIKSIDGYVVISDDLGQIRFYDKELRILFWCPSHDSIDSVIAISFDLKRKHESHRNFESDVTTEKSFSIRDFFVQTKSDIFSVDVSQMKFDRIFHKSDDFITAIDIFPLNRSLICCGNYSGRIFLYDYEKKVQVVENQLKLQKRKSSSSDTDIIRIPHISAIAFSDDGHHLLCGLENGTLVTLDPNVLHELKSINVTHQAIVSIKFAPDSSFATLYDEKAMIILLHRDKTILDEGWKVLGKVCYHTKAICDVLFISPSSSTCDVPFKKQVVPRLISLAEDRQIVEYDLMESLKESRGLVITFTKRIFQTAVPMSMTLVHINSKNEDQLLIADNKMKFKLFDKNTFEILATFLGPIYDSNVKQFDASTSFGLTNRSKFFIFTTNKNICLFALPIDGNPFRTLGIMGHCDGIRAMKVDSNRRKLFTIGNKCQSLFMWNVNSESLFEHLHEGGTGLKPYCDLLPGGKFGFFFQQMLNLYFYMLMLSNNNSIDDRLVKEGLDSHEVEDFLRGLGFFPTDYETECLHHELQLRGKMKIPFEDLVKLYINHSHSSSNGTQNSSFEISLKNLFGSFQTAPSEDVVINKSKLISILTESAEKIDEKDAELYLKEIFRVGSGKFIEEIPLSDFMQQITRININSGCIS